MDRLHLRRLDLVFPTAGPVYFVTFCTLHRRRFLAQPGPAAIVREAFVGARVHNGWRIGRWVVMPDHVHFFCCRERADAPDLSGFIRSLKVFCARRITALGFRPPVWQPEFFDHVLRHNESLNEKREYMRQNPVRAGLVERPEDWPWQGEEDDLDFL